MTTTKNQHSPPMISNAAINEARRLPGRCSRRTAQIRPSASIDKDNHARRLICSRVGGGAFERFATRSMGDDEVVRGAPQPMHTVALSLTARPHSLHVISVMVLPPKLCSQAAKGNPAGLGRRVITVLARSTSMRKLSQYGHGP